VKQIVRSLATILALGVAVCDGTASAQCPQWSTFGPPGFDRFAIDFAVDPSSAGLYVLDDDRIVHRWDGSTWSALPTVTSSRIGWFEGGTQPSPYVTRRSGLAKRWNGTDWIDIDMLEVVGTETGVGSFDDGNGAALLFWGELLFFGPGLALESSIARFDGTTWSALGTASDAVRALAVFDDGSGPDLYAAGEFTIIDSVPANRVARLSGTGWSALGSGIDGTVRALEVFDDGSGPALYAAGSFTTAGGVAAQHIARWDGTSWSAFDSGLESFRLFALETFDDGNGSALFVGGDVTMAGGVPTVGSARWDGATWSALDPGTNDSVATLLGFDDGTGPALAAGGGFDTAGGQASHGLARWSDPCASATSTAFCFGTDELCPCGNGGLGDRGCDIQQGTGGVKLAATGFRPDGFGGGLATFVGSGFPPASTPTTVLVRDDELAPRSPVFGDGILCIGATVTRVRAAFAIGGTATYSIGNGVGAGDYYYQLWFRNTPAMFCTPDAFNLSNAYKLSW